jgi:hypothetical protein
MAVLGMPDIIFYGIVAAVFLVGVMIVARKKPKGAPIEEPEHTGVPAAQHTDLDDLLEKRTDRVGDQVDELKEMETGEPLEALETKESIEDLLAAPIDSAPTIGKDSKTKAGVGLETMGVKGTAQLPSEKKRVEEPPKPAPAPVEVDIDIDQLEQELESGVPEPPPTPAEKKGGFLSFLSSSKPTTKRGAPIKVAPENAKLACMGYYDAGMNVRRAARELYKAGISASESARIAADSYNIWLRNRKPIIEALAAAKGKPQESAIAQQLKDSEELFK